ncbi:hypothetical protein JHK87_042973 [Glycine soja]|nr:hypothetical protein JHK87_042973 [Glycine soja]
MFKDNPLCVVLKYQPTSNTTTTKTTTTTTATTPARETKPVIASPSETKHPLPQKWNFLQKAAASALDMVKTALVSHEWQHPLPKTANPRVQIAGNFTPVPKHLAHQFLPVIGKIPKSIECVYVRNGANPLYEPVAGNHFFDSNDMVHVVKFHSGAASYTCHFTETQCLSQEKIFGRHVFPKAIGELHNHSGITRLLLFYAHSRPSS